MIKKNKYFYLHSLGCPKNYADSEGLAGYFLSRGYVLTGCWQEASVVLLNTCAFIQDARDETTGWIDYYSRNKGKYGYKLVVLGCFVEYEKSHLLKRFDKVDIFAGSNRIGDIYAMVNGGITGVARGGEAFFWEPEMRRTVHRGLPYRYLKISEGCNRKCSFCEIPAIRGRFKSNSIDHLCSEAEVLVRAGAKELILVSQDTACYGKDLKKNVNLIQLTNKISRVKGLEFLRLMYLYPECISDELIRQIRDNPVFCRYFDIPVQHVSDKILRMMNRSSRKSGILKTIERIKKHIPDASLRTTLIAGFPGEGKAEFRELLGFVEEGWFDHLGVFAYSEHSRLKAFKKACQHEVRERMSMIYALQKKTVARRLNSIVGLKHKVLIEKITPKGSTGRSFYQAPEIDGHIIIDKKLPPGSVVEAVLSGYGGYNLKGAVR